MTDDSRYLSAFYKHITAVQASHRCQQTFHSCQQTTYSCQQASHSCQLTTHSCQLTSHHYPQTSYDLTAVIRHLPMDKIAVIFQSNFVLKLVI